MTTTNDTHSKVVGYGLWLVGFTGAHRFYYGRPITGTIWFFTLGLLGIGWLIDLFLIPGMDRSADRRYVAGAYDYSAGWLLHRFYLRKWLTGLLYLVTGGLLGIGYLYDLWTFNSQINEANASMK